MIRAFALAAGLTALLVTLMLLQPARESPVPPPPPPVPNAEYRIEDAGDGRGWIRHADGRRWPLDDYHGETARLEVGRLPGIGRTFLVVHVLSGAYTFRIHAFEVHADGALTPCATGWTIGEGAQNESLFEIVFGDLDGDGREEFIESRRRWIVDERAGIIDSWAVCTIGRGWTGERFEPDFIRLQSSLGESPLLLVADGDVDEAMDRVVAYMLSKWLDAGRDLMRDLAATDLAESTFRMLMFRNGVDEMPYFDLHNELLPIRFTGAGETALLILGCRAGGGGVYVFDEVGRLRFRSESYGCVRGGRADDLDGDGLDEILFAASGGGTGLHYDFECILTAQGGRPREILSIVKDGYDFNYCGHDDFDVHNWRQSTQLDYECIDDGVRLRATTVLDFPCECTDRVEVPSEHRVETLIWRPGADGFEPER